MKFQEPLEFIDGIIQCEEATEKLGQMIKSKFENGMGEISAVKERKVLFQSFANDFARRLSDYLSGFLQNEVNGFLSDETRAMKKGNRLAMHGHEDMEEKLFRFKKLLVWLKDAEARIFRELQLVCSAFNARNTLVRWAVCIPKKYTRYSSIYGSTDTSNSELRQTQATCLSA
jgi:hypothetical protein